MTETKLIDVSPSDFALIDPITEIINLAIDHTGIRRKDINYCSIYSVLYDLMHAYKLTPTNTIKDMNDKYKEIMNL